MAKEEILNFKIETEIKKLFKEACKENFSNPSHELRLFVHQYLKRNQGSKILLTNLNQNV